MIYVPGEGSSCAKLMIVGEAPGAHEEREGHPFIGPSGAILNEMLSKAGVNRSEVYVTNVVKIRPPNNDLRRLKEYGKEIEDYLPQLYDEISAIKPNCILALGNTPLFYLTGKSGITNYRGSILNSPNTGVKVVPTFHPANLLRTKEDGGVFKYSARAYMQLDIKRAIEESHTRTLSTPSRHIQIIRDSHALYKFLEAFNNHNRFGLDIETIKTIPSCIAISPASHYAASIQLVNLPGLNYSISSRELAEIHYQLAIFLESNREFIGQNFKFDQQKLEYLLGMKIKSLYADTMLFSKWINPEFPASLAFLTSVYTREPFYKDEGKEFILGKNPVEQLFNYNGKDACVLHEILAGLEKDADEYNTRRLYYSYVNHLHDFYYELEDTGLKVDLNEWKRLLEKYSILWKESQKELESLAGYDLNPNSPLQVKNYMEKDLQFPFRMKSDEDTLVGLLGNHAKTEKQKRSLELILSIRRIRKTIGTYLSSCPDFDGRMRTSYRISGTETGRTSTTILNPPLRPVKGFGQPFQVYTKHGEIGSDIRKMYVADEGFVFLECDQSQAEARIVALLSQDEVTLKLFDTIDIHCLTASWLFGRKYEDIGKDSPERFIGKTVRHAGNYGMGKKRLMLEVNSSARRAGIKINLSEKEAGVILIKFHSKTPKIQKVFQAEIEKHLKENNRILINPFGRRRQFFERWGNDLLQEGYAQIPQSTVGDKTKIAGLAIKKRRPDIRIAVESHDALVGLVPEDEVNEVGRIFKEEFEKEIDFSTCSIRRGKIVIPAELKVGKNYLEMKKYAIQ